MTRNRDDEVDLIIDAWAERLPGVDVTPLDAMSRLRRVAIRLDRTRAAAFATAELSSWEFDVLAALRRSAPPHELTPATLIRRTMIGSAAMTNRLDNLVERGLVEREPNPSDGRSRIVRLTAEGAHRVDAAMRELIRREDEMLQGIGAQDRTDLVRILRALVDD